jgi:hypothetical protein
MEPVAAASSRAAAPSKLEVRPADNATADDEFSESSDADEWIIPPLSQPDEEMRPARHQRDGFDWRERDWQGMLWLRPLRTLPTVVVSLALLAGVLGGAFLLVTHAVGHVSLQFSSPFASDATPTVRTQPVITQSGTTSDTPTPAFPQYTVGVWPADPAPPSSGSDKIFVRISNNAMPVKDAAVTIFFTFPGGGQRSSGLLHTDAHGLATYTLVYGGVPAGRPIVVTATAKTPSGTISATTYVVPV